MFFNAVQVKTQVGTTAPILSITQTYNWQKYNPLIFQIFSWSRNCLRILREFGWSCSWTNISNFSLTKTFRPCGCNLLEKLKRLARHDIDMRRSRMILETILSNVIGQLEPCIALSNFKFTGVGSLCASANGGFQTEMTDSLRLAEEANKQKLVSDWELVCRL